MLVERAEVTVREGSEDAFAAVMHERGVPLIAAVDGVRSVRFGRGVENPQKFMLLVEWQAMDAHIAFTQTPAFGELREIMMPFSTGGAMEHFTIG